MSTELVRTKRCTKCSTLKPLSDFPRNKNMPEGLHYWCKECGRESSRKWREANPEAVKEMQKRGLPRKNERRRMLRQLPGYVHAQSLKRLYGMTREEYLAIAEAQGNTCAICHEPSDKVFHVDHDHATGKIRGLLCGHCNKALGMFKDDPIRIQAAAQYLRRSEK